MKCTTIAITVLLTGTALADSNKAINSDSGNDVWKSSNESREMTKESVRNGIKKDLEFCSSLNCQLDSAMQNLRKERQSQERMLAVCRQNAGLYRAAMLHADKCGVYPTYVQNRYFSREELRAQIRLLMTQAIGHEATIKRLEATTRQSETG